MATRFYLPSAGEPDITPAYAAEWDATPSTNGRRRMVTTRINSGLVVQTVADGSTTANRDILSRQYVSDPIAAQEISGTARAQVRVRELNDTDNLRSQMVIRVVSGDGLTVRGTLYAGDLAEMEGDPTNEFATGLSNRSFPAAPPATLGNVTAERGDRLVVELGARKHAATTASMLAAYLDSAASDLDASNSGATNSNPWVEFSHDVTFDTAPLPSRVSNRAAKLAALHAGGWI